MAGIDVSNYEVLVNRSLAVLDRNRAQDIASAYQNTICGWVYDNFKQTEPDGKSVKRNVVTELGNNFQRTQPYGEETLNIPAGAQAAEEGWRHTFNGYAYDERIIDMNGGKSRIVSYLIEERAKCFAHQAEQMETEFWSTPTDPNDADEKLKNVGVAHWVVANASKGFNGGAPSGYTTVGGLSPTTYPNWSNYTDTFAAVSEDDFFDALREMMLKIKWRAYAAFPGNTGNTHRQFVFCGTDLFILLEKQAKLQDQIDAADAWEIHFGGNDPAFPNRLKMGTTLTIFGMPVIHVPWLDNNEPQTKTLYCLDFDTLYPVVLRDWWNKERQSTSARSTARSPTPRGPRTRTTSTSRPARSAWAWRPRPSPRWCRTTWR